MNVASLELCKELYELSGWDDTTLHWSDHEFGHTGGVHGHSEEYELITGWVEDIETGEEVELLPAYTLGYLLRKLRSEEIYMAWKNGSLNLQCRDITLMPAPFGELSPEDVLCKLAIELFKQGVIKREES